MSLLPLRGRVLPGSELLARRRRRPCRFRPLVNWLEERRLLSTFVVQNLNDSGTDSLRAAILNAQNGDTIKFAKGLNGTITLTSGSLVVSSSVDIDGPGAAKLTISGGGTSGVFLIESPFGTPPPPPIVVNMSGLTISDSDVNDAGLVNFGATMTLKNVTVTANQGGGIANLGIMTLKNSEISGNTTGVSGSGLGLAGGIFNFATLNVTNSDVSNNLTQGGTAVGGGILSTFNTTLNVSNSTFQGNQAVGNSGGAFGAAIHTDSGAVVTIKNTTFSGNVSRDPIGFGQGAAIDINGGSSVTVTNSLFSGNQAIGGSAGNGGAINDFGSLSASNTTFSGNLATGDAKGGFAQGGAIIAQGFGATIDLSNDLLYGNSAVAGPGGGYAGGIAAGGALDNFLGGVVTVENTSFLANQAVGGSATGSGNQGGLALGGGIESYDGTLTITGSLISGNQAVGGAGTGGAVGGNGEGGGIENDAGGNLSISSSLIAANMAQGGAGGGNGFGGGVYGSGSTTTITDTLITLNFAIGGGGQGIGGGIYTTGGTTTLAGKTKVISNFATTSNNNIYSG